MEVAFSRDLLASFKPSRSLRFHAPHSHITSLDFDDTGNYLLSSGTDESLQLYDAQQGTSSKSLYSKKYGCTLVRFAHSSTNCVYASTKEDDTIRYLSLHDNQFIRYFRGHKRAVTSIQMAPVGDMMYSAGRDHTVRAWDIRSPNCHALLDILAPMSIGVDPSGNVLAVACDYIKQVALYDVRNLDSSPFATFKPNCGTSMDLSRIEFSNDGKSLLLGCKGPRHYVLNAFSGAIDALLEGHTPFATDKFSTSGFSGFTPDGRYVYSGSANNSVYLWDLNDASSASLLHPFASLEYPQNSPTIVEFNPRKMLFATADTGVTLWLPESV
ncbi:hypothetical protein CANCADRAFT_99912 [Tortispora caseinolytica NRRL Y-17796]|uniref:Anaphase-promoting complex subunit 4 WD40 domain-containing protein n=1 Tax=Tortispora caseinolytica NRRL Y-17796 TaxID=767744 RepID=A0A1E4TEE3_9ASCO|nr:hypothetical protein CANCADRAFT_99912 [Tortispora caseinolytica NRRL Y-17796]